MTDKQIIVDGVDISGCEFHSLTTMGYAGYNYCKCFECVCECHNDCYYKRMWHTGKEKDIYKQEKLLAYKRIEELEQQLKAKEQECESLRNLLVEQNNVMKTNELMIKEFGIEILKDITTDDITVRSIKLIELQQQLDQLKKELTISIQENEEGREINAELKAELEQEKALKETYLTCYKAKHGDIEGALFKLKQTLTDIKEIAEKHAPRCSDNANCDYECEACHLSDLEQILNKISEVEFKCLIKD